MYDNKIVELHVENNEADITYNIDEDISYLEERGIVIKKITNKDDLKVVKIFYEQLVNLMDTEGFQFNVYNNRLTKVMMVGLQGSGKTTACAKLASLYRKKDIKPMMVACDVYLSLIHISEPTRPY